MTHACVTEEIKDIFDQLEKLNVNFKVFEHQPAFCVDDVKNFLADECRDGMIVKNLFVTDKKGQCFLVLTTQDKNISYKLLEKELGITGCRMGSVSLLASTLHLAPGSVSPLASVKDTEKQVKFVFDLDFKTHFAKQKYFVHPSINTVTLAMTLDDIINYVEKTHEIMWINIASDSGQTTRETSVETIQPAKQTATSQPVGAERLGITAKKSENFGEWYTQVILRSEMIDYYDVSGCYILRPNSFFMWESEQQFMDALLKVEGVQNAYFPIFVSKNKLETEKEHVAGFSPEVAWVTRYGNSELAEPIAIRPTSETIIYPSYSRWIRSHRDLPLKLNQWCQVVRWEFKQPTPFIRTREFLWQEGHTAHATDQDAHDFMLKILDIYQRTYEEVLAVPVIRGFKSDNEKFAGGKMTSTIETFICENGRAVQAATSHHLGTNFSKMFEIEYEDRLGKKQLVHQTSWGYTTRSVGICVMIHADDRGMVMPPNAAPVQVVAIPIKYKDDEETQVVKKCESLVELLKQAGVRVTMDDRDNYTPGWKFNDWETKGVCIRIELGPRDMAKEQVCLVRRDTSQKKEVAWKDLVPTVVNELKQMHADLLNKAEKRLHDSIVRVMDFKDVLPTVNKRKLVLVPWCEDMSTEEQIKEATRQPTDAAAILTLSAEEYESILTGPVKSICVPFEQPELPEGTKCFFTGRPAKRWWIFGRSY